MPRYRQLFCIGSVVLGTSERDYIRAPGQLWAPLSKAYFCRACGEVWARCIVTDQMTGSTIDFTPICRPCEKHDSHIWSNVPGSLFVPYEHEYNNSFPDALVKYEFDKMLQYYKDENEYDRD